VFSRDICRVKAHEPNGGVECDGWCDASPLRASRVNREHWLHDCVDDVVGVCVCVGGGG
jgi:hypothetical protein